MSSQDWICQSVYVRASRILSGGGQPLTICNIAQAGSLCVSNKYLTALFQSFPSLCILDVVTIYADVQKKTDDVSL